MTVLSSAAGGSAGFTPIGGTSASTPLLAGIIALMNDQLAADGFPPLGFLNPMLYDTAAKCADCFNDVTLGDNNCSANKEECCPYGFAAAKGFDAATGLGTPNVAVWLEFIKAPTRSVFEVYFWAWLLLFVVLVCCCFVAVFHKKISGAAGSGAKTAMDGRQQLRGEDDGDIQQAMNEGAPSSQL
jgi:hypothetical protein